MDDKDSEATFEVKLTKVWIIGVGSILGLGGGGGGGHNIAHAKRKAGAIYLYAYSTRNVEVPEVELSHWD